MIASIYESRPNVTTDIVSLALKSGNACFLRGGKETLRSNTALVSLIHRAIGEAGLPTDAVQFVDDTDRALVDVILGMKQHINLLVPRGGTGLINFVAERAQMPVVTGGVGVCHTYVDRDADTEMAANIVYNAKVQRPTVCNAMDTVLVHSEAAARCLPEIAAQLNGAGVEMRCDHRALSILGPEADLNLVPAQEEDFGQEFLALIASVRVVDSLDDALEHIETYGSGHSEAIVTQDETAAQRFLERSGRRGRVPQHQHPIHRRRPVWPGGGGRNQHAKIPRPGPARIARVDNLQVDRSWHRTSARVMATPCPTTTNGKCARRNPRRT